MIISRKPIYSPITITLQTQQEADRFLSIIDKIDANHCKTHQLPAITKAEYELVRVISDSFTNFVGIRP
jgi:hypothetical protein